MGEWIKKSDAIEVIKRCKDRLQGKGLTYEIMLDMVERIPSADRPQNVIAQITFDEEKLREVVKEAVERFKEEYEITDRPQGERVNGSR